MNQPADYPVRAHNGSRAAQVIQIDSGKHVAIVAICALVCGVCTAVSWIAANRLREDALYTQDEYQKVRNHVIELEARQKALADELQEMKHHE